MNGPLWSLSYEAIYYLAIGCIMFVKGHVKWVLFFLALLIGGPLIAALFPIWALGYAAYFLSKRHSMSSIAALALFCVTAGLLVFSPMLRSMLPFDWHVLMEPVLSRYIDAFAFFGNLLAASRLAENRSISVVWQRRIAVVASSTFVLYLFHRPLLQFFSYVGPADSSSRGRRALVIGGTLVVVLIATPLTERFRQALRTWLTSAFYNLWPREALQF